jgi:hypothetical protein
MASELKIGVTAGGTTHNDREIPDIATKVKMVKEAGVFDYIDRTPPAEELEALILASAQYGVPVYSSGWFYTLGRDEQLIERNIAVARAMGSRVHNMQIMTNDADGKLVSNERVAETYLRAVEFAAKLGVTPSLEVHVNMWSEHFGRVAEVAQLVERRGVTFNMTLDHSHVIFKIDNPREQEVQNLKADVESGRVVLDPAKPGNVCQQWIDANWVRLMHARATVPNNPINVWGKHPDGKPGRGIQYPFVRPKEGEWHSPWDEARLEPWKQVVRHLLRHHAKRADSNLACISCEFIPAPDYGMGAKYSIFEQNAACARWMRETWRSTLAETKH